MWTEFGMYRIVGGLLLLIISLVMMSCDLVTSILQKLSCVTDPFTWCPIILALFHGVSVFSNSFIIEEHWFHLFSIQSIVFCFVKQVILVI